MRTASPTQDSMDVDLPAYRQVTPAPNALHMVRTTTFCLSRSKSPIDSMTLLDILKDVLNSYLDEQPSNPFSKMGLDGLRAFVDDNPELKQSLEQVLKDYNQNQIDTVRNQLNIIYSFFLNPFSAAQLTNPTAEYSWKVRYVGDVAKALSSYLHGVANEATLNLYARYASIVQSSGTGKSRAVDEMSKEHFVIPINLRAPGTTGYPPPDEILQSFLCRTGQGTQDDRYSLFCAFLQALFQTTVLALDNGLGLDSGEGEFNDNDRPEEIASKFRKHMSSGMSANGHGPYRIGFYKLVTDEMNKVGCCFLSI
ncbi:hypothetical protein H1R20_g4870, partial [Candolleomyces eurysporus]